MILLVIEHGLVQLVGKMLQPQAVADRVAAYYLLRTRCSLRIGFNSIVDGFFLFSQIPYPCVMMVIKVLFFMVIVSFLLHRNSLLALVVLTGAVGVERLVADPSAKDFFEPQLFRGVQFIDIVRLIVVIIGHG